MNRQFERILIMRGGAIGDFVLTLPAIRAIRESFSSAHICIVGNPPAAELGVGRRYADSLWRLEDPALAPLFARGGKVGRETDDKLRSFDLIVAFWRDEENVLADNMARVCAGKIVKYDPLPPGEPKRHAADHLCGVIESIGVGPGDPVPRLFPNRHDLSQADDFFESNRLDPAQTIAIHPGSGGRTKNWPAERFAELSDRIASETDYRILLISGPADDEPVRAVRGNFSIAKNLPLPVVAAALSQCRAYVGNDSGITHIAAAVGTATIAIFGPTDPEIWGPRGEKVTIIRGRAPCMPCSREERLQCKDRRCLSSVAVDEVWRRVLGNIE